MKIALIEAGLPGDGLPWRAWTTRDGRFTAPSVGLVSLASLARDGDEVEIIDEKVSGPADGVDAEVAGISFKSMNARRAYALADTLRARGVRVILGGLHASLCPEEAGRHADVVAVGEGEPVWRRVLDDVERGRFEARYDGPGTPAPIDTLPAQRVELLDHERYLLHSIQTARGCSLDCEFCPTRAMFGHGFRLRDLEAVADEARRLLEIERKPIFFSDDIFGAGDPGFITALTSRLKTLAVEYAAICDLRMLTPAVIGQLAASGCKLISIDFLGGGTPEEARVVRAVQREGMSVLGYIMLGFEHHPPEVFRRVVDFVRRNDVRYVSVVLLAPYPGTPMGQRLAAEGRVLCHDWDRYDQAHVVFEPARFGPEELERGHAFVLREIGERYDIERTIREVFHSGAPSEESEPCRTSPLVLHS
jgi:radical SAM superfamily enzyme YgiQ (UPF0313 family)